MTMDYDDLAREYALYRQVQPEVLKQLLAAGTVAAASHVLEVGCGTGNYIAAIQNATGCRGWGIDPSRQMLAHARGRSSPVIFEQGRGEKLPLPDARFDLVFSVDAIHHMEDRLAYFKEAWRVLKPGGRVCTVTESEAMIRSRQPFAVYFPDTVAADLTRYPAAADLEQMMREAGFVQVHAHVSEMSFLIDDIQGFRDRAYSCLHLIPDEAFQHGIQQMERHLRTAPIRWVSRYLLVWCTKPQRV
jgi:ubiquinone/menaquinone biosynthesis C-methylase UbiE